MAASSETLNALHELLALCLKERLEADRADGVPTDGSTLGVIARLLKDNNITADPADSDTLKDLQKKFAEQRDSRSNMRKTLALVKDDLKEANG